MDENTFRAKPWDDRFAGVIAASAREVVDPGDEVEVTIRKVEKPTHHGPCAHCGKDVIHIYPQRTCGGHYPLHDECAGPRAIPGGEKPKRRQWTFTETGKWGCPKKGDGYRGPGGPCIATMDWIGCYVEMLTLVESEVDA